MANLQDINDYLSFMLRAMVVFGIAFVIPLIVLMLNIVGVVKATQLSKYRTLVIFGTFVFGAVATPSTDPFSMLALAAPMAALFLAAEVHRPHPGPAQGPPGWRLPGTICCSRAASPTDKALRDCRTRTGRRPRDAGGIRLVVNPSSGKGRALRAAAAGGRHPPRRRSTTGVLLSRDFDEARTMAAGRSPTASTCWR